MLVGVARVTQAGMCCLRCRGPMQRACLQALTGSLSLCSPACPIGSPCLGRQAAPAPSTRMVRYVADNSDGTSSRLSRLRWRL